MRIKFWLVLINVLVLLGACGGSTGSGTDATDAVVSDSSVPSSGVTPTGNRLVDYLALMGCENYTRSQDSAPFAQEWGECTFRGGRIDAYLFPDENAVASFFDSDTSLGLTRDQVGVDGLIVLSPTDPGQLETLRNSMGR